MRPRQLGEVARYPLPRQWKAEPMAATNDVLTRSASERTARTTEAEALWLRYREEHDTRIRNRLAHHYFPLVNHVARSVSTTLLGRVELDDLEGYGAEGLLDAIERFDSGRGVQFSTFAAFRIRGAIYDGIRASDWLPRSVRRRERELRDAQNWLSTVNGRAPTENEEAGELGIGVDALRHHKAQVHSGNLSSLDVTAEQRGGGFDEPADATPGPLDAFLSDEISSALRDAMEQLSERERAVVTLSITEEATLAEIGRRLGVTESRACQIRSGAFKILRARLEQQGLVPA
jgi:RNA polymerase sigma factor for flagellar operon FliA